jgi:hypothetical protein
MTTWNEPPLTRRAARLAEQSAQEAPESIVSEPDSSQPVLSRRELRERLRLEDSVEVVDSVPSGDIVSDSLRRERPSWAERLPAAAANPVSEPVPNPLTVSVSSPLTEPAASLPAEPAEQWRPVSMAGSAPAPLVEPVHSAPSSLAAPISSAPTGSHWTAGLTDGADNPLEGTFSRSVGSAAASTNALVLPEMPIGSLAGPVPGTGEILITGRIELPASIASTGAASTVHDSPEIDDFAEDRDVGQTSSDSAPVSAVDAVSRHIPARTSMVGTRPRGNLMTTVLIISTLVMAVASVTIFGIAAANGRF